MRPAYNFINAQQLLIKPSERLQFVSLFIIGSCIYLIINDWIYFYYYLKLNQPWQQVSFGGISGAILGVIQWLVLRKYIPDWRWILAVAINSALFTLIQVATSPRSSISFPEMPEPVVPLPVLISIGIFGPIIGILIYGFLQWYIIQPFVRRAKGWIFLPFLVVLVAWGIDRFNFIIIMSPIRNMGGSFTVTMIDLVIKFFRYLSFVLMPIALAFGFCCLRQKPGQDRPILISELAAAPDISHYWQLKKNREILYLTISKRWQTELSPDSPPLRYLIGVDQGHTPIIYEAMDQISLEQVTQTPLPELFVPQQQAGLNDSISTALAKFQVTFTPPASVNVVSVRGIPLFWLGMMVFAMVLGLSILSGFLEYLTGRVFF
jgi:hypothetical protein